MWPIGLRYLEIITWCFDDHMVPAVSNQDPITCISLRALAQGMITVEG